VTADQRDNVIIAQDLLRGEHETHVVAPPELIELSYPALEALVRLKSGSLAAATSVFVEEALADLSEALPRVPLHLEPRGAPVPAREMSETNEVSHLAHNVQKANVAIALLGGYTEIIRPGAMVTTSQGMFKILSLNRIDGTASIAACPYISQEIQTVEIDSLTPFAGYKVANGAKELPLLLPFLKWHLGNTESAAKPFVRAPSQEPSDEGDDDDDDGGGGWNSPRQGCLAVRALHNMLTQDPQSIAATIVADPELMNDILETSLGAEREFTAGLPLKDLIQLLDESSAFSIDRLLRAERNLEGTDFAGSGGSSITGTVSQSPVHLQKVLIGKWKSAAGRPFVIPDDDGKQIMAQYAIELEFKPDSTGSFTFHFSTTVDGVEQPKDQAERRAVQFEVGGGNGKPCTLMATPLEGAIVSAGPLRMLARIESRNQITVTVGFKAAGIGQAEGTVLPTGFRTIEAVKPRPDGSPYDQIRFKVHRADASADLTPKEIGELELVSANFALPMESVIAKYKAVRKDYGAMMTAIASDMLAGGLPDPSAAGGSGASAANAPVPAPAPAPTIAPVQRVKFVCINERGTAFRNSPAFGDRFEAKRGPDKGHIVESIGPLETHDGVTYIPVADGKWLPLTSQDTQQDWFERHVTGGNAQNDGSQKTVRCSKDSSETGASYYGLFFNVKARADILIRGIYAGSEGKGNSTGKLYSRAGSYEGQQRSSSGWDTVSSSVTLKTGGMQPTMLGTEIRLSAGETRAFHLHGPAHNESVGYVRGSDGEASWQGDLQFLVAVQQRRR
jgi:hypothetical protein